MKTAPPRVALVHDWLVGMRGGEYVLEAVAELYPNADIFTLVVDRSKISPLLAGRQIKTSLLQYIPGMKERYRYALPLMPWLAERFDLSGYDLVISTSHCVAKGVRKAPHAKHVSIVFTPMRYMWDRYDEYFAPGRAGALTRFIASWVRKPIQAWDRAVSQAARVDVLLSISEYIREQVRSAYGRDSSVLHCFADLKRFVLPRRPENFYLMVGAFAPYKRVDLAVEAFNKLGLPLWIVGGGQDERRIRALAGPNIRFLGSLSNADIAELYARCRAFVFPGKEDFGITPIEAMASGAPVIAYQAGGALDTVAPECGIFFREPSVEALSEAVMRIESGAVAIDPEACRRQAQKFTKAAFQEKLKAVIRALPS